jgi:ABC-type lipoprotein export system ATPase subunit
MKLVSFRIENFKSIIDTGWVSLSKDGISCLIGQNESGKSSVLEALHSFGSEKLQDDYLRNDMTLPKVSCKFQLEKTEANKILSFFAKSDKYKELVSVFESLNNIITVVAFTDEDNLSTLSYHDYDIILEEFLVAQPRNLSEALGEKKDISSDLDEIFAKAGLNWGSFTTVWEQFQPTFILFNDDSNLLPNEISVKSLVSDDDDVDGKQAALNLLKVANIDIARLEKGSERSIKQYMDKSNKNVTAEFQEFWTQKNGRENKIELEIELKNRDSKHKHAGEQFLQFWIKDGEHTLHPKQRSKGVRWFISFYLSLKADAMTDKDSKSIFLIDEPGANLHARAQEDVLGVFESIRKTNQVVYSTHSQHLIEFKNLHRLLAIQRRDDSDESSETIVIPAYRLGMASTNTLAPIMEHMGIDFSNQNVIAKKDNIVLEEISAYYYLLAFEKLTSNTTYNYLPATGVNNIEQLVLLLTGWGISFSVVFDDDNAGRKVFNSIKKNLYQDDDAEARKYIYKIRDCDGIEDMFTQNDFYKVLLKRNEFDASTKKNSELAKELNISKPLVALDFHLRVKEGEITVTDLEDDTLARIKALMESINSLVANQK